MTGGNLTQEEFLEYRTGAAASRDIILADQGTAAFGVAALKLPSDAR
jgi:indolepyruvate decarboxylase